VPKGDARSPIILSADEYDRLLEACSGRPMLSLYTTVLGEAGLRCESEALWLRWEDVDLERGFLHVVSGRDGHRVKSGRSRFVPLTARLLTALKAHFVRFRFSESPWVFHHAVTRRHHLAGDRIRSLRNALRSAAKRAKVSADFHPHDACGIGA
jgi:integrase